MTKSTLVIVAIVASMILATTVSADESQTVLELNEQVTVKIRNEENVPVVGTENNSQVAYECRMTTKDKNNSSGAGVRPNVSVCTLPEGNMKVEVISKTVVLGNITYQLMIVSENKKGHLCRQCPKGAVFNASQIEVVTESAK